MTRDEWRPDSDTLDAVANLLTAGGQYGIGVSFEPDGIGWRVGYLRGMGGGELANAYDLLDAARAALRPLMELGESVKRSGHA